MTADIRPQPERIRPESPADVGAVHAVHAASFPSDGEARVVDALRAANRLTISLVAEVAGAVVGHVAFSPVALAGAQGGVGLAPVAVLPAHRGRGVADRLIRAGLERCRASGRRFVVVLGDPRYYARFGFRPAGMWNLHDEYGGGDAFQALELEPGALPPAGGLVRYAEEFGALDDD